MYYYYYLDCFYCFYYLYYLYYYLSLDPFCSQTPRRHVMCRAAVPPSTVNNLCLLSVHGWSNMVEEELLPAAGWHDHQGLANEQFTDEQPPAVASCQ